ncbi:MAG: DUF998 domain-containing protein [Acidimicrobiales bacterium]
MRIAALAGIVGPTAFVGAWAVGAAVINREYSSIDDTISRLAAIGARSRPLMNVGFIGFGVALPIYATALRRVGSGSAWLTATAAGIASLAVAATPLERSATIDNWHGAFAGAGYVALAATPLMAARPLLRQGHRALAGFGLTTGAVSAIALVLTTTSLPTGLFQRVGLTAADIWIATSASAMVLGRLEAPPPRG